MYKHSVRIDKRKCVGCTNCIKCCPTEALRVQQGKAKIMDERCIDCGNCLRVCPHNAMVAMTTPLSALGAFKYNIVIPSTTLYSQFRGLADLEDVYAGLYAMGFDAIYEEAKAAEIIAEAMSKYIHNGDAVYPIISCTCPVIPRMVAALYPNLIDNLSPFIPSNELAARVAKEEFCESVGVPREEVGAYYISPCAAEMTHIKAPMGMDKSDIDGVFAVRDVYALLLPYIGKAMNDPGLPKTIAHRAGAFGLGSAVVGGLSMAVGTEHYLAVDGMDNVMQCLDDIENERMGGLVLVEAMACSGGCVGGPLTFENKFVAKNRNRRLQYSQPRLDLEKDAHVQRYADSPMLRFDRPLEPKSILKLSDDVVAAVRMMDQLETITKSLPGLDCGSCGSPTCRTLAEDIVKGHAVEMDCIFKLRDKVRQMAQEMVDLASAHKRG
ncbi:MAG: [Fe-Fe] hydrogenase large subunit C-terminal domain-containing protein [Clostridia bacterium]|nr:[Fe-Fe] hydrogenase large subunit C-terminal domain-containing protein [Clostridia bacterium]